MKKHTKFKEQIIGALTLAIIGGILWSAVYVYKHFDLTLVLGKPADIATYCSTKLVCAPYPDEPPKICSDTETIYFLDQKQINDLSHCALTKDTTKGFCRIEAYWNGHDGVSIINLN